MTVTKEMLISHNVGENLDALMCLDPRGYGVCRILYAGSRKAVGEPLTIHAARALADAIKPGDAVFLLVGFVLPPHRVPEMDGMVSTMLLARSIVKAFDATPVIVCPQDSVAAIENCASVVGLHCYEDIATAMALPLSIGVAAFTKIADEAMEDAAALADAYKPSAVISVECCGANGKGIYHNASGMDVSDLEAKSDVLWQLLYDRGVTNVAIGDLGNEIGMHSIADHIARYVPYTAKSECTCGCGCGILSATDTDNIITATCSDWGCYGLIAALAYLLHDIEIMHPDEMEGEVMRVLSRNGIIDMTGSLLPGVDGFDRRMNMTVFGLMRQVTDYAIKYDPKPDRWFGPVLEKGFFDDI